MSKSDEPKGAERRQYARYEASLSVDYRSGQTFLFSYIRNISEMGIFIGTEEPLTIGTQLTLRFNTVVGDPLEMQGEVVWVNHVRPDKQDRTPGMGVEFRDLTAEKRERVVELVKTIAYLGDDRHEDAN
ncbi:MAG: TIGR02266 family protein [Myxococcales bacterium]|nr:TIGR02266 family protein [Myxococcales bacterium]MCB9708224.1 TIGR02266 family protein [Myxococcales bacterium]